MTREEHLTFCKRCTNRTMDLQQGLLCNITGQKANFEGNCESFHLDETVKEPEDYTDKPQSNFEIISSLPQEVKEKLIPHQDLSNAIIGGFSLSVISALIWAVVTVATEYQIGYMAIGVGFLVGMGVRFFGAGVDQVYGLIGGFFALLGCLLGNLFSQVGFIADVQTLGYLDTLMLLNMETIQLIFEESFAPIDLLFYGIAVYEGYKFSFRSIPEDIKKLDDLTPLYSKLRMPVASMCVVILLVSVYLLSKGVTGDQIFYYESGKVQSQGMLREGKENGPWQYYYENGNIQAETNYKNGLETGIWKWYSESEKLFKVGNYNNGLFDGTWLVYNENGILIDSSNYSNGRLNGAYTSYHENGKLFQIGQYVRDKQTGQFKTYNKNGFLISEGRFNNGELAGLWKYFYEDGTPSHEIEYIDKTISKIMNAWDFNGEKLVSGGNGTFKAFFNNNSVSQEGKLEFGKRVGEWKTYFGDGKLKEVGNYVANDFHLTSAWNQKGEQMVKNGNGEYTSYFDSSTYVYEKGSFKNGLKNGYWEIHYPNTILIQQELNFVDGKVHGRSVNYYNNGNLMTEGVFDKDKKVGEWKWYYESGQLQCSINYENDKKQGDQVFYSEAGIEAKKEVYEDGKLLEEVLL
ncbi:hypothetical protein [Reichenbachiella sp. MALMAid0571]|uniref:toxin-antitoxin system YwqK family antitoxin n=1 Tax=Reichenbachiella sp. MALMAid0571 TaxID=3143939 RepID=UPI0032DFFF98